MGRAGLAFQAVQRGKARLGEIEGWVQETKISFTLGENYQEIVGGKTCFPATVLKVELGKSGAVKIRADGRPHF